MKIKDICTSVTDGSHNPPQGIEKSNHMMLSSKNIFDDEITFDEPRFLSETDFEREHKRTNVAASDVLLTIVGTVGRTAVVNEDMPVFTLQRSVAVLHPKNDVCLPRFLMYALMGRRTYIENIAKGVAQKGIYLKDVSDIDIRIPSISNQKLIISKLDKVNSIIKLRKEELCALDHIVKSRFMELFGDLKSNSKGWPIVAFTECAEIDTNMIHDFDGYENYPHIGIDSIEKETGRLSGYRTVAEAGVISGKYLFTEKHIIYSKIRPNLNKVAMPDFVGVCSADAYPILAKDGVCEKVYLAYTMRSKYFLDYILALSSRTNLPKVNKKQVEGFALPLPPIGLQQQFAAFAAQVDKSKLAVQKSLQELEMLKKSLMQKYFG